MEAFSANTEVCAEDSSEPPKSRVKFPGARLFTRSKRAGVEFSAKFSQSASDILAGKAPGSEDDLACPQGIMGSRALSHDSIFWADQVQTDDDNEPVRVSSQENVLGKVKALQVKLLQQKMHLGPPPLVLPIRRQENGGGNSHEGPAPHKSPEFSTVDVPTHGALRKVASHPLSPIFKPPASKFGAATTPSPTFIPSGPAVTSPGEFPLDFSTPAQFTPSLDTSAARHRMSIKPRNQRVSTKRRAAEPDAKVDDMNNHPEPVADEHAKEEVILEERGEIKVSQQTFPKSTQPEAFRSEATLDRALPGRCSPVSSQELQAKLQRRALVVSSERAHPYSADSGIERKTHKKSEIISFSQLSNSCASALSRSAICLQDEADVDSVRGLKRPGSGSFHSSITSAKSRIEDRPRSGSFVGVVGQAGSRHKVGGPVEDMMSSLRQRDERKDLQPGGRPFAVGKLRQEQKSSGHPCERQDSAKNVEGAKAVDAVPSQEVEGVVVATKVEIKVEGEEEAKTMFGFKLRSTSNSMRFWSDGSSGRQSRKSSSEEPSVGLKSQESRDSDSLSKNANAGDFTQTDPVLSCKPSPPSIFEAPTLPTDVQSTSLNQSQELQSTPQTSSPEVSWMSLAMEKTRSLQQLFARRFPKDCSSTAPQIPEQTANSAEMLNEKSQSVRLQEWEKPAHDGGGGGRVVTEHGESFQKTTVNTWKEPEAPQSHVNTSQPALQRTVWTKCGSPSRSAAQSDTPSQFGTGTTVAQSRAQSYQTSDPLPWSQRGLQPTAQQPKYVDQGKCTMQEKESPSLLGNRSSLAGSVSGRAAFLERQAEWCCPPLTKGVELRKAQLEIKTEPLTQGKDTKPEEGFKPPESQSPIRVPDRPREEKWTRKNLGSSLSPSSSPILRSTADSAQPSWMELAKRKSMAWSDKTMD
ncbi:capping protein inhibiting regulator of actin dynamics [Syngnathus acus]|uniref:capping protein inhibiting regulator of actin dynamics n=1 Tax=Syngnathus acus TaxID=161584 RepID=UPI00188640C0|nr:capping protein inhibiting regulator of actin dynamics [Syngnathus acus]